VKNSLIFVTLALFCTLHINAKQTRLYGDGDLSCNLITSLSQDGNKFIWIGTSHGLNKFDGWKFSSYYNNENDSTSLLSNYVICLYKDSEDILWVGSNEGLQYYQAYEDRFITVQFPEGIHPTIRDIVELHNGEMWIATSGWGIYSVDKKTMQARSLADINEKCGTLYSGLIYQDRSSSIWLPLENRKILRIVERGTKTYQIFETPGYVNDIVEDAEGRLFISSYSQVCQWEPVKEEFIPLENHAGSFMNPQMLYTQKGLIYIASHDGLHCIDNERKKVEKVDHIKAQGLNLNNTKIVPLLEDHNGNIWLGCYQKGLLMIPNEKPIFHYWDFSAVRYDSDITISTFYKDRSGRFWAGTDKGQLLELNANGRIKATWNEKSTEVVSLLEDSENGFWVGRRHGGVSLFNKQTGQFKHIPEFQEKYIKWITEGPNKQIYFSVFGDGLKVYSLSSGKWKAISGATVMKTSARLKNNWINTMLPDSKGRIWLGHYSGVSCYDVENDCFIELGDDQVLDKTICYSLLEDSQGNIWIGTSHGLFSYSFETKEFIQHVADEDLPRNLICGLAEDKSGNIWYSTFKGIRKISPTSGKMQSFLSGNGLFEKEYSPGIYFQDKEGTIYFSSVHGVTHFIPEEVQIFGLSQKPVLTGVYLNNQSVSAHSLSNGHKISQSVWTETSGLTLSHKDNTFSLAFSMMDFHATSSVNYEYRLRETDYKWIILPQGSNRLTYNNLPPGKYTLEVRANENGTYSPVRNLEITILPPWYLSLPVRICYILILLGCSILILHWQYKRLQKKRKEEINEEKMKFFINVSHEIRSPMTMIISPLSMLLKKEYDEVTTKALHSMYRNTNRILTLINQMLDIQKIDKGQMRMTYSETDLVAFIQELIEVFEYQANEREIELSFKSHIHSLPIWIDRNNFDKVLVNLIGNALKFTDKGGHISLLLTTGENPKIVGPLKEYAEIQIIDSGVGLDEGTLELIFERFYQDKTNSWFGSGIGLNLCKTLVGLHHGEITAANRSETKGSCFTIRIPLGSGHLNQTEIVDEDSSPRFILNQNQATELIAIQKKQAAKSRARNKILIIDDNEELLLYLKEELDTIYKVITSNNADEGLCLALEQNPDLIISDVVMPGMDGFTLLKKIKVNGNINHIPVILLTSKAEYDNRIKGWDKGADAIMGKPFNIEELILLCTNLISNRLRLKGKFSGVQDQEDKAKMVELKSNDEKFMERVMAVINENMENPLFNVEICGKEVGISRVQLHRKLKEITGMSSGEFIKNIRLRHSASLLQSKKINVSQVAYKVGFTNPALFSIAFKKYYGVSPSEFCKKEEYQ